MASSLVRILDIFFLHHRRPLPISCLGPLVYLLPKTLSFQSQYFEYERFLFVVSLCQKTLLYLFFCMVFDIYLKSLWLYLFRMACSQYKCISKVFVLVSIRIDFFLHFFTNCRRPGHPDAEFAFSLLYIFDCIGGVIVSVLDSSVVGRVFESQCG